MSFLDTTYFIDFLRRPKLVRDLTLKIEQEGPYYTSVITVHEILTGLFAVKDSVKYDKLKDKLFKALAKVQIIDFTYKDALKSAELAGSLLKQGKAIGNDTLIASTALNRGLKVITHNVDHFNWICGISDLRCEFYGISPASNSA